MYSRILVVTGDQSWEDAPVEYAIALAANTGAELSILTVPLLPLIAGMPDVMAYTLIVERVVAQSEAVLAEAAAAAEQAGVAYTTRACWGNPADVILRTAEEEDCDLIIVGSHACTWRSRRVLRHVITKLTSAARQPLLLIAESPEEAYRWRGWERLFVVYDGSPESAAAVHYALVLAQEAALEVCLLHVQPLRQLAETLPHRDTRSVQDMLTLVAARTAMAGVSHDGGPALGHNTVTAITETAADRACDVIILGVEPHSGWKRLLHEPTVKAVMANTTLPVLLVNRLATPVTY